MNIEKYIELKDYVLGKKKADLCFKNASVLMLHTSEIIKADVAVHDGYIVGVGNYSGKEEIDCSGVFLTPGFVDSHLHFESTMSRPRELVYYASKSGTTTFIADPHEAANVSGIKGIEYILNDTNDSYGDVYIMLPSCVPAKKGEDSGAILDAESMKDILNKERILGLGEVMDCKAVVDAEKSMMEKLSLFDSMPKDGHALGIREKELSAYIMSGILTDHECSSYEDAISKVRQGMYVHIREGSAAKNLKNIVEGIVKNKVDSSLFNFCTDDKHIEDIISEGHISNNIRKSISLGMDTLEAYKIASYNPSVCYGLNDIGMIAVGKKANIVLLNDLEKVDIKDVYYNGKKVESYTERENELAESLRDTVHIDWFTKDMLKLKSKKTAISLVAGQLLTKKINKADGIGVENKVVVIERHHNKRKYHSSSCFNFGIENGSIAISVSHDSHNVVAIGDNDDDIMKSIEALKEIHGGIVLVYKGKVFESLSLSIMGLMCDQRSEIIKEKLEKMKNKAYSMGVNKNIDPFITLSFIALPVIPEIRITTNGLYSVLEDEFLD